MNLKLTLAKATLVSATLFIMTVPAFAGNGNGSNDPGDGTGSGPGAFIISHLMESPMFLARSGNGNGGNGPGDGTGNGGNGQGDAIRRRTNRRHGAADLVISIRAAFEHIEEKVDLGGYGGRSCHDSSPTDCETVGELLRQPRLVNALLSSGNVVRYSQDPNGVLTRVEHYTRGPGVTVARLSHRSHADEKAQLPWEEHTPQQLQLRTLSRLV